MPFESANPPIATLSEGGFILTWANWSFLQMFGEDAVGRDVREVVTDVDPSFFEGALQGRGPKRARFERKRGARPRLYEAEIVSEGDQRGLVVRDETRVVERDLIVRSFTKKLELVNRRLTASGRRMQLILDHASNGFFALDGRGRVLPEVSGRVSKLLGCDPVGRTLGEMLPGKNGEAVEQLVRLAIDGAIPEALLRESLDFDWSLHDRTLRLELELVADLGGATIFGVLHDVTALRLDERAEAARIEHQALVWAAAHHPEHFVAALTEAREFAGDLRGLRTIDPIKLAKPEIRRDLMVMLHTIKAAARALGADQVCSKLHELESAVSRQVDSDLLMEVTEAVESLVRSLDSVVSLLHLEQRVDMIAVDSRELHALARQLAPRPGCNAVAQRLRMLALLPFADGAGDLDTIVQVAANDRGKEVELRWAVDGVRVDRARLRGLLQVLPHVVRNAVVHGIESPELRMSREKPVVGTIRLSARIEDGNLCITIEDDGGGVNRRALATKLGEQGLELPLETDADLLAALCVPHVSTAELTDQHAGRGVGLSAVADEVHALGGTLRLESVDSVGSRFVVTLPIDHDDPVAAAA